MVRTSLCVSILLFILFPTSSLLAKATPVALHTGVSEAFTAYAEGPEDASVAVVLVHDWFGVTPFYTEASERLAREGYRVLALDLYDGRSATTHEEAQTLLGSLDSERAGRKIDAAIKWFGDRPRKLAVMGFSMGAGHALAAALRNSTVQATVLWYGPTINDPSKLQHLAGPALLIVGSKDGPSAGENAAAFSKAADAAGSGAEVYVYPGAAHAFAQPLFNQGRTYDPVAGQVAWHLTEDFLQRRLH